MTSQARHGRRLAAIVEFRFRASSTVPRLSVFGEPQGGDKVCARYHVDSTLSKLDPNHEEKNTMRTFQRSRAAMLMAAWVSLISLTNIAQAQRIRPVDPP